MGWEKRLTEKDKETSLTKLKVYMKRLEAKLSLLVFL